MGNTAPKCGAIKQKKQLHQWTQNVFQHSGRWWYAWVLVEPFWDSFRPPKADFYCTERLKRARWNLYWSQADAQTDSQWRVVQQASAAMTQGLQTGNDWGWDEVHSPGTHHAPHQGFVRETHVANRKTQKRVEERERRGRNTSEGIEWVGGWLKSILSHRNVCWCFICQTPGTSFHCFCC